MKDILKSDLPIEYQNFWHNMGVKVQKHINGIVKVYLDTTIDYVVIRVFIKKFNYGIYFKYPYKLTRKEILQDILNAIQYKIYTEVFKMKG